jgi:hypothetical protein
LRKFLVHQGQTHRILGRVQELFELVELTEDLKRPGEVLQGCTGMPTFHAPNRIDRGADSLSQAFLGKLPAATSQGHALPDSAQGAFNRKWDRTIAHGLSPESERLNLFDAQIWLIILMQARLSRKLICHPYLGGIVAQVLILGRQ